ncbi:uncharacterized protein At2g29880-like [Henckelia pumila]|uniref:uncharacterized protein At2g29880-like n=1 Tax=Henckelia pumila TaxID=405737 RepID=UPI003C6E65B6
MESTLAVGSKKKMKESGMSAESLGGVRHFEDYKGLKIMFGKGTATGKYSKAVGDDTDARTSETEGNKGIDLLNSNVFDYNIRKFARRHRQDSSYQPPFSEEYSASPLPSLLISSEVRRATRKRDRTELEANSSTYKNIDSDIIYRISHALEKIASKIESILNACDGCWDAIKEVPNLDNCTRSKVLDLLNSRSKRIDFLRMTIEERSGWINYKLTDE